MARTDNWSASHGKSRYFLITEFNNCFIIYLFIFEILWQSRSSTNIVVDYNFIFGKNRNSIDKKLVFKTHWYTDRHYVSLLQKDQPVLEPLTYVTSNSHTIVSNNYQWHRFSFKETMSTTMHLFTFYLESDGMSTNNDYKHFFGALSLQFC